MSRLHLAQRLGNALGGQGTVLANYFRRLLSPPLPGDGLLLVGFAEGLVGWPLSAYLAATPAAAPLGVVPSIVGLWVVLTAVIVWVGVAYTAPAVRRKRVWLVWGALNGAAVGVNLLGLAGALPTAVAAYAFWHPWIAVFGLAYLATAALNPGNPQLRTGERAVYGLAGVASLGVLAASFGPVAVLPHAFLIGGALHLLPMGFDVTADVALLLRGR